MTKQPTTSRPRAEVRDSLTASAARPVVSQTGTRADIAAREKASRSARWLRLNDERDQNRSHW